MVENDDSMATPQINSRKLKKKFNNHYQLYPPALFKTNVRKKKLNEKISTLKTQINKIDDKVRNHKYTLKTSKSEIIIKKQSITKKQSQIDKEKSSAKRKKKQVDSNATKVKELKKERKNLWASISHLIPYSDLIS